MQSRNVAGSIVVCRFAVFQLQAQNATCTNWKTFALNSADLSNPTEESEGVNDNHTVVGTAFYNFNKPNFKGFVHLSNGTITYWKPSNAKYSWLSDRKHRREYRRRLRRYIGYLARRLLARGDHNPNRPSQRHAPQHGIGRNK